MPSPYSFDSSAWIVMRRHCPPDIFKTLWSNVDGSIMAAEIRSPDMVLTELKRGSDELAATLKKKAGLFVPVDGRITEAVRSILAACPTLADVESPKNEADPFVVGLAMVIGGTVVCQERPAKGATGRQRIPNACALFGIHSLGWQDFLREMGWTF